MFASFRIALGTVGVLLMAGSALAQFPPVTDPGRDEQRCQKGTSKALAKLVGANGKCVARCIGPKRSTMGPYAGCFAPEFFDPAAHICTSGAEAQAQAGIVKACARDCPECYQGISPTLCSMGDLSLVEPQVLVNVIYCTEALGGTPTAAEARCEDTVNKALAKLVAAKTRCYGRCTDNLWQGKLAPGSCDPPLPADAVTAACIFDAANGAEAKAAAAIDRVCAGAAKPACYSAIVGGGWVALAEAYTDYVIQLAVCGSPDGAFLD